MSERKVRLTRAQLDALLSIPDRPVGEHLADEDFTAYAAETLDEDEVQRLDAHLLSCARCAAELEELLDLTEAWRGPEGERRLAAFGARLVEAWKQREPLRARLARMLEGLVLSMHLSPAGARAATKVLERGQTPDGLLRWRLSEDEEGGLVIRLGSHELALEGVALEVRAGSFREVVELRRAAPDQVGAQVRIRPDERARLAPRTALRARLPEEDDVGGSQE